MASEGRSDVQVAGHESRELDFEVAEASRQLELEAADAIDDENRSRVESNEEVVSENVAVEFKRSPAPSSGDNVPDSSGEGGADGAAAPMRPPRSQEALLWMLSAIEGADNSLLPCSMFVLREDLGLTLNDLATLNLVQSLLQTLSAPLWAFLADRHLLRRRTIFLLGAAGQGVITVLLALVTSWYPMIALRALNGLLLASLKPVAMGFVADVTAPEHRGKIYGGLNLSTFTGMLLTTLVTTPVSTASVGGFHGWRVMFAIVGVLSIITGCLVWAFIQEPTRAPASDEGQALAPGGGGGRSAALREVRRVCGFFKLPTFNVLILQGIFGSIGMSASAFATMYYQYMGVSSSWAGIISACGLGFVGVGIMIGGHVGDAMAKRCGHHGRVLVAELSLFVGVPLKFLCFWGIPPFEGSIAWYLVLNSLHGLLATWCVAAAKLPLLSEIVPPGCRSTIMAWDSAIEGSWGTLLGGPLVAVLAQSLFGFTESDLKDQQSAGHVENARALGQATAVMICGPALVSAMCWFLLHWSYPRDLRRVAMKFGAAPSLAKTVSAKL